MGKQGSYDVYELGAIQNTSAIKNSVAEQQTRASARAPYTSCIAVRNAHGPLSYWELPAGPFLNPKNVAVVVSQALCVQKARHSQPRAVVLRTSRRKLFAGLF